MAVGNPISLTDNVASRIISQIATESQTDFTISGGYRLNAISVYRNGVRLVSGRDYSAADGSTVVLLSGASLSDVLEFHIFDDFRVADAIVSNASHQNIEGNLTISGILTATSLDLTSLTVSDSISIGGTLTYEDVTNVDSIGIITARTDLHVGAGLSVVGVSTFTGNAIFSGDVDLGSGTSDTITIAGKLDSNLIPSTSDQKDIGSSSLEWRDLYVDGTGNIDTLVSGDGTFSTNLGIGTANPTNYGGAVKLALSSSGHTGLSIAAGTSSDSNIFFADGTAGDATYRGNIKYAHDGDSMRFFTAATEKLRITSGGDVGIGLTNPTEKLHLIGQVGGSNPSAGSKWDIARFVSHNYVPANSGGLTIGAYWNNSDVNGRRAYIQSSQNLDSGSTARDLLLNPDGGDVGIGTNAPSVKLEVATSVDGEATLATFKNTSGGGTNETVDIKLGLENTVASNVILRAGKESNHGSGAAADNFFAIYTTENNTSSEKLRITSTGALNIGKGDESTNAANTVEMYVGATNETYGTIRGKYNRTNEYNRSEVRFGVENNSNGLGFLAFATGNNSATERLRITSTGLVGIGTNDPNTELEIQSATDPKIRLQSQESGNKRLDLWVDGTEAIGYIAADQSASQLAFRTTGSERLRITSTGLVGIGTDNPQSKLEVFTDDDTDFGNITNTNNTNSLIRLFNKNGTDNTAVNNYVGIRFDVANGATSSAWLSYVRTGNNAGAFQFKARNAASSYPELMRITSAGNIGIGTDIPGQKLDVIGGNIRVGKTSNGQFIAENNSGAVKIKLDSDGVSHLSGGNVGVGTNNPENRLHIYNAGNATSTIDAVGGDALLKLRNSADGNYSGINFIRERSTGTNVTGGSIWMPSDTSNNGATLYIQTQSASAGAGVDGALTDNNGIRLKLASQPDGVAVNSAFSVELGSTEKFRVAADGNIGIGSESPVTDVDISQKTGAVALPQGTTAQRPSGSSPYIRYNTTNSALEFYNGTEWVEIITDYFPTGSTIIG